MLFVFTEKPFSLNLLEKVG